MAVELLPKILPNLLPKTGRSFGSVTGGDIADLIRAVGLACPLFLDVRRGVQSSGATLTGWGDARGTNTGMTGPGATINADGSLTFDGVAQYLRFGIGLGAVTSDCAVVLVMKGQASIVGNRAMELSTGATVSILTGAESAGPQWSVGAVANANCLGNAASPQILHSRRKVNTGFGSQVGAAAEVTAANVGTNATVDRLTIGANRLDVASAFANITGLRAVMVFAGDYTGKQALVNAWAQTYHGAVP